jgi:rod shape determining protein RodA
VILRIDRRLVQNVDWPLLAAAALLMSFGLVTLASLGAGRAGGGAAWRQMGWAALGLLAMVGVASVDYRRWVRWGPGLYLLGLGALGAVLAVGRTVSGARRWLALGPLTVQPSELFKLCFVLMLVRLLLSRWAQPLTPGLLAVLLPLLALPFGLIVRQPDLGTALLLVPVTLALLVGAGIGPRLLAVVLAGGVAVLPGAWFFLREYQRERLWVFLDPLRDPLGSAYNVLQAKIAIGSGQLLGKGIAGATQSRLAFLPERHTDFIFAVFAEMWGFLGCLVLLGGYAVVFLRGFDIAATARDPVGRLLALGATALLAAQTLINLGMVSGLLPVVGIPLPFMSYGGSSLVASLMTLGLLLSVRMRQFS